MKYDTPASAVVLHAEHSAPRGVLHVEHSILMGAAHRAPYSYRVLHTEHSTPTGVLHTEHSTLTGCCTQSTVLLQSAAHRAKYSHRGAAHRAQYSHRGAAHRAQYSHMGAAHRKQYSHRVLYTEHTTPAECCTQSTVLPHGCWTWKTVLLQYSHRVLHTEHSPSAECSTQNTVLPQGAAHGADYTHTGDTHRAQYSCNTSTGGHTPGVSGRDFSICHCDSVGSLSNPSHFISSYLFSYFPPLGILNMVFSGRNDAEAETPVLWPPHVKS